MTSAFILLYQSNPDPPANTSSLFATCVSPFVGFKITDFATPGSRNKKIAETKDFRDRTHNIIESYITSPNLTLIYSTITFTHCS